MLAVCHNGKSIMRRFLSKPLEFNSSARCPEALQGFLQLDGMFFYRIRSYMKRYQTIGSLSVLYNNQMVY